MGLRLASASRPLPSARESKEENPGKEIVGAGIQDFFHLIPAYRPHSRGGRGERRQGREEEDYDGRDSRPTFFSLFGGPRNPSVYSLFLLPSPLLRARRLRRIPDGRPAFKLKNKTRPAQIMVELRLSLNVLSLKPA